MKIRPDQYRAFEADFAARRLHALADHLRAGFRPYLDRHGIAPAEVEAVVAAGLEAAQDLGVTARDDLTYFVECQAVLGPRFYDDPRYPWAREILNRPAWSGTSKMDAIAEHLLFEVGA